MFPKISSRNSRIGLLVLCVIILIVIVKHHASWRAKPWHQSETPAPTSRVTSSKNPRCDAFPDPGNIAIAVKTGATEAVERIPILMLTTLQCAENVLLFSDLEQNITGYHLHDALTKIPRSVMEGNSDFEFYWKLKKAEKYGQIERMLKKAMDPRITTDLAAWTLDKYKQLHILEMMYEKYPGMDWYVMVDADTYLVWPNLLTWLKLLPDPRTNALYLGSPADVGDTQFAHGGSGMLISQAAMYKLAVEDKGVASRWDKPMHDECCGDLVIGMVFKKYGVLLKPSWPTINGEKPITLPFGPTHWCQPVVTMHHVEPDEMSQLANFELSRNTEAPLTFVELFNAFTKDILPERFEEWDNYCLDGKIEVGSYEACQSACEADPECFQFANHGRDCMLGHSIHLGVPKDPEGGASWRSGWLLERIRTWADKEPQCKVSWPWT